MSRSDSYAGEGLSPKVIGGLVLAALALVFVFQNTGKGRVSFLFWDMELAAWVWMLVLFLAGVAVGLLLPKIRARRQG